MGILIKLLNSNALPLILIFKRGFLRKKNSLACHGWVIIKGTHFFVCGRTSLSTFPRKWDYFNEAKVFNVGWCKCAPLIRHWLFFRRMACERAQSLILIKFFANHFFIHARSILVGFSRILMKVWIFKIFSLYLAIY